MISKYIEQRHWSWQEGERKAYLSLCPDGGITLTTADEYGVEGCVRGIPPQVALRMADYLTEMAREIERRAAGGWVGAPETVDYGDDWKDEFAGEEE